ncbi:hypothetical protein BJY01DRAFT_255059 [Aspergillus pseudoustus]|uniref:Xylanolytic transcriptional activator regulatory domain-containing protein n=1 Tax=Aspergillus pseudoustus TaxID=1810923 RepID=A0ABR4IPZ0_9EURO
MPILDLETLIAVTTDINSIYKNMLLFQAVMFTGSAFVDVKVLSDAGFSSRREARESFLRKAKLLYAFNYEVNPITNLQLLFLMIYGDEIQDERGKLVLDEPSGAARLLNRYLSRPEQNS